MRRNLSCKIVSKTIMVLATTALALLTAWRRKQHSASRYFAPRPIGAGGPGSIEDHGDNTITQDCRFSRKEPSGTVIMNSRMALTKGLVILGIGSLIFLSGCGSSASRPPNGSNPTPNQPPPPAGVTVSPSSATVQIGGVQQFTATVNPSGANQAVTWSVRGTGCSGANCGTIDATGKYTAPATVPNPNTVVVWASSVADPSRAENAPVIVITGGNNPVPTISFLNPDCAPVGAAAFTLFLWGSNFVSGSVVRWNGSDRPTTVIGGGNLSAQIPASDIAAAGTASATVFNPSPGGGSSVSSTFTMVAGGVHPVSVAVDPAGKFVYVANQGCAEAFAGNVSMYTVDAATGALTSMGPPVAADFCPVSVTVNPSGKFVYVANSGCAEVNAGSVSMYTINASTGALTSTGAVTAPCAPPPSPGSCTPWSMAVDPSGKFAYVANEGGFEPTSVSMYTIDATTGTLTFIGTIAVAGRAWWVAVDPSGKFVYVANSAGISMYSINTTTGALTATVTIAVSANAGIAVHPSGRFAYVTSFGGVSTYTIDATTGALTATGSIVAGQSLSAIHPSGKFAYLASSGGIATYTIDTATGVLTATGSVAAAQSLNAIHPSGKFAYGIAGFNSISMYSIDASTGSLTLVGTIGT